MTLKDYARHRGCYPRAVEAALASGRIQRDSRGLIDSDQADADWTAYTNPLRSAATKRNGAQGQAFRRVLEGKAPLPERSTTPSNPVPDFPTTKEEPKQVVARSAQVTDLAAYAAERANNERLKGEHLQFTLDVRKGKYIERDVVQHTAETFWQHMRDVVLAVPDRLPELDSEHRAHLEEELRSVFERNCRLEEHLKAYAS